MGWDKHVRILISFTQLVLNWKSATWLMLLFNKQDISEIRKVGLRNNLITISEMKENSSEKSHLQRVYRQNMQPFFWTNTHCLQLAFKDEPGIVVYICNPSTQAAKAGRSQVPGQPELYSQTLSQKVKKWRWKGTSWRHLDCIILPRWENWDVKC
jgi:hypothetical protein